MIGFIIPRYLFLTEVSRDVRGDRLDWIAIMSFLYTSHASKPFFFIHWIEKKGTSVDGVPSLQSDLSIEPERSFTPIHRVGFNFHLVNQTMSMSG